MMRLGPFALLIPFLVLVTGGIAWVAFYLKPSSLSPSLAPKVTAVANKAQLTGYGPEGAVRYRLLAERMHFTSDEEVFLEEPRWVIDRDAEQTRGQADTATFYPYLSLIEATGTVRIVHLSNTPERYRVLASEAVRIWPESDLLLVPTAVLLATPTRFAHADRLLAANRLNHIELIGDARLWSSSHD